MFDRELRNSVEVELVHALEAVNADGELLYDDVIAGDAMALLLVAISEQLSWRRLGVGSRTVLKSFFQRSRISSKMPPPEIASRVRAYFKKRPLPNALLRTLGQLFHNSSPDAAGLINETANVLSDFAKSQPRVFDGFVESKRPAGTFGGGNLARLALLTGKEKGGS
jgi:hypothetical protein